MPELGRVMFWLCVAIGVMVGGALFVTGIKDLAVYVLGGMVALGLLLRWIFRIFRTQKGTKGSVN